MRLILLCLLLGFGVSTNLNAQQEKTTKKVRIVKKMIDKNGNETLEEIEAEGEEAERLIKEMKVEKREEKRIEIEIDDKDGTEGEQIKIRLDGVDWDTFQDSEEFKKLPQDIQERVMKEMNSGESEEIHIETEKHIEIKVDESAKAKSGAKKQQFMIKLDGDDLDTFKESQEFKQLPPDVQTQVLKALEAETKDVEAVRTNTQVQKRVRIKKIDGNEKEVMEWQGKEGEDMPEDIKKILDEQGIELDMDMNVSEGTNVFVMEDSPAKRATLGVQMNEDNSILKIMENSAAAKAALKKGDVIKKINGLEVTDISDLIQKLGKYEVGEHINLEFERKGKSKNKTIILQEADEQSYKKAIWIDKDGKKMELQDEDVIIIKKDN